MKVTHWPVQRAVALSVNRPYGRVRSTGLAGVVATGFEVAGTEAGDDEDADEEAAGDEETGDEETGDDAAGEAALSDGLGDSEAAGESEGAGESGTAGGSSGDGESTTADGGGALSDGSSSSTRDPTGPAARTGAAKIAPPAATAPLRRATSRRRDRPDFTGGAP
ncbi:hypothetical protein ACTI_15150 [Actinoplanes sp. OR16]|nr:hypothetical protein ACTI_15150 [Actinoplanes sp. OR16]